MIKKDITFIYWSSQEKSLFAPIIKEAEKRGYRVKLSNNKFEKCEIGFYCQHINFPQYSKLSVVMLHDILQQYGNWPDIWYREPWNIYDIGILPSEQWVNNWNKSSHWYYTRPRKGIFKVGWPKADVIKDIQSNSSKVEFYKKYNLDLNKRTILYAPAWENDHKQDDFVKSMLKLDVNILIKQAKWPVKEYPQIVKNIEEMYDLHKDIPSVTILPPETNIFEAIAVSDILVSEESSTLCEAAMMPIPSVSVSNWLIPDVSPSRFPKCDYDFVIKTKREELTDCIRDMIENYDSYYERTKEFSRKNFSNIGLTAKMIIDILDDVIANKNVRYQALVPTEIRHLSFKRYFYHKYIQFLRLVCDNYVHRAIIVKFIWNLLLRVKHAL